MSNSESNINEKNILDAINIVNLAVNIPADARDSILNKYENINSFIGNNTIGYTKLLNKTFLTVLIDSSINKLGPSTFEQTYPNLTSMLFNESNSIYDNNRLKSILGNYSKLKGLADKNNIAIQSSVEPSDISDALKTWDLQVIDAKELEEELENSTGEEVNILDNIEIGDIEDIDNIDIFDNIEDIEIPDITDNIDITDGDDNTDSENTDSNETESDSNETESDSEKEDTETVADKEKKEKISKDFGGIINKAADTLVNIMSALYADGFAAMPQEGIYINNNDSTPLIRLSNKSGSDKVTAKKDSFSAYDMMITKVLTSSYPQLGSVIDTDKDAIPSLEKLAGKEGVCHLIHLQFQSANVDYCTGRNSIRKWITETQLGSNYKNSDDWIKNNIKGKSRKLTSFKSMIKPWYRWCIKNMILDALVEVGVESLNDIEKANSVIEVINRALRNVIVVQERDINKSTETINKIVIKVSTSRALDIDKTISLLESSLNLCGDNTIKIKEIAHDNYDKYGVLTLSIQFADDVASSSDMFACDIIDRIIESGNTPSWDHALLGKKEDGTYFFWDDFTGSAEPFKRNYTIYAGSRSGKGVMTSTLIASAMCDGRHVFYTDGKPENGACLGEIAWAANKEAYVFDGQAVGKKPFQGFMEEYTFGVRKPNEVADYIDKLPRCLFENKEYFKREDQKVFLGVMRYLKSLQLCSVIVNKRAGAELPMNDWQIWIFDEMTDMSNNEKKIRAIFARYVRDKTGVAPVAEEKPGYYRIDLSKVKEKQLDKNSDSYDEGLAYIAKWNKWTSAIVHLTSNLSTISIGKANTNLIFIFQEATWISRDENVTTIAKVVKALKSTKIIGRNALANACGDYGDGPAQKSEWYKTVQSGEGWWAISESADARTSKMHLFKPYKVWTTPIDSNGDRDPNAPKDNPKYVGPYIKKLLGSNGIDPAEVLNEAYEYANDAVVSLGYADSIKEYIYDCTNFAVDNIDISFEALRKEYENGGPDGDLESESSSEQGLGGSSSGGISIPYEEDEEPEEQDDSKSASITGSTGSAGSNISDKEAFADFERPEGRKEKVIRDIKFTTVNRLRAGDYSKEELLNYFNKYGLFNTVRKNIFTYSDRGKNHMNGLFGAVIYIGNYVYLCGELGVTTSTILDEAYNKIQCGNDRDYKNCMLIGMIKSFEDGTLQFDTMPSKEMLRAWINKYSQTNQTNQTSQTSWAAGNSGLNTGSESNTIGLVDSMTESEAESLSVRILRLSEEVVRNRNWTAQQLLDFQVSLLLKLNRAGKSR